MAVLGIFTMNIWDMAYPEDLVLNYHVTDPNFGWNYWTGITIETLFSGKLRGIFTLLFGVSAVILMASSPRAGGPSSNMLYFGRLGWLMIIGLIHAYFFLWWGEVVFKYAVLGILLFAFRDASYTVLMAAAAICIAVLTIQPIVEYRQIANLQQMYDVAQTRLDSGQQLTAEEEETIDLWLESQEDMQPFYDEIEDEVQVKNSGYFQIFKYNAERAFEEQTAIFLKEDLWDMLPYMLLGMMLFRMGYFDDRVKQSVHLAVAFFGVGIGLSVHTWLNLGMYGTYPDPVSSRFYLIFFDLGRLPFVLGYISLFILVFRVETLSRISDWMVSVGKMALSNYFIQSVIGAFLLYGFGFALFNQLDRLQLLLIFVIASIFQIIFSVQWMERCYCGPVEWIWRSLSFWKVQPLRRF